MLYDLVMSMCAEALFSMVQTRDEVYTLENWLYFNKTSVSDLGNRKDSAVGSCQETVRTMAPILARVRCVTDRWGIFTDV